MTENSEIFKKGERKILCFLERETKNKEKVAEILSKIDYSYPNTLIIANSTNSTI